MAKKYVYQFKDAYGLGKELLGGKGAGLAEMTHIGVRLCYNLETCSNNNNNN